MGPGFSETIIIADTNPIRFEKFCRAICERSEQLTFVPTSFNYDQGRDARSIAPSKGSHRAVLCITLNQDIDAKVEADLRTVSSKSHPDRLVYCCSQPLTEHRIDKIGKSIRRFLPKESIQVLSSIQLAALAEKYPEVLPEHYPGEIQLIRSRLLDFEHGTETTENRGLRLALIAFGSEDAITLRRDVSCRAVLEVLCAQPDKATEAEIADRLSSDLRLPKILDLQYIQMVLKHLEDNRWATWHSGSWKITKAGSEIARSVPVEAARALLNGRTVVRTAIEALIGLRLTDSQFETIWTTLLDVFTDLFYSNGIAVITAINEFIASKDEGVGDGTSLEKLIEEGAARIRSQTSNQELGEDIEQAIRDVFTERSGPAFEWLTRVCERFVALCALGLETSSSAEVRQTLARYRPVLDSDIVITVLCVGEPTYKGTREILSRFLRLGGQILVSPPVLEEVAYHAHISEKDFRGTLELAGHLTATEVARYTENAFVRAFYTLTHDVKRWAFYKSQFVGGSPRDYSKILGNLQDELMVQVLPAKYDQELADNISEYLHVLAQRYGKPELVYHEDVGKAGRDAQILASIAAARQAQRETGSDKSVILLSSSSRLRHADRKFRDVLGLPESVVPLRALAYMMSLVPDIGLGAGTLRQALFDFGETAHLTDVQRLALRVIKASGTFDVPWAKRRRLREELEAVIRRDAEKRGVSPEVVTRQFLAADASIRPGKLILDALSEIAAKDNRQEELFQAKSTIRKLEEQVEALNEALSQR